MNELEQLKLEKRHWKRSVRRLEQRAQGLLHVSRSALQLAVDLMNKQITDTNANQNVMQNAVNELSAKLAEWEE